MRSRWTYALVGLGGLTLWGVLPLAAESAEAFVYTYEGRTNLLRNTRALELVFDLPVKNGDLYRAEQDSWIDLAFYHAVGLRFTGPGELRIKSVSSLSGLELAASGGGVLLHVENPGETIGFSLDTPTAVVRVTEPILAYLEISADKTDVFVKKGRMDVVVKSSDSVIRVIENQKLGVDAQSYIPSAQGLAESEKNPAERARTVYVPKKGGEEKDGF